MLSVCEMKLLSFFGQHFPNHWPTIMVQMEGIDQRLVALDVEATRNDKKNVSIMRYTTSPEEYPMLRRGDNDCSVRRRRNNKVHFSPNCKLVVFPGIKRKYKSCLWYQQEDFAAFRKRVDRIASLLQSYDGPHSDIYAELGTDHFLGLESYISYEKIQLRREWRMAAYRVVFGMQQTQSRNNCEAPFERTSGGAGSSIKNTWSSWVTIAESYERASEESKRYALEVAKSYIAEDTRQEDELMLLPSCCATSCRGLSHDRTRSMPWVVLTSNNVFTSKYPPDGKSQPRTTLQHAN